MSLFGRQIVQNEPIYETSKQTVDSYSELQPFIETKFPVDIFVSIIFDVVIFTVVIVPPINKSPDKFKLDAEMLVEINPSEITLPLV